MDPDHPGIFVRIMPSHSVIILPSRKDDKLTDTSPNKTWVPSPFKKRFHMIAIQNGLDRFTEIYPLVTLDNP